ncbi:hypothetical protein BK703_03415 [Bacillus thuringiensis serovar silo]|uniref:hypothetical protein n=1 Tax=Bacillus thuringiensis TaxID=1428 RepID=UPI000A373F38|nr:hypothetical protein [Bacillus thuringiensis]MED3272479.1 hypothetical protein [Bacillus thuringiensis]OTW61862.1 hypothetical protein BK703_03415 [Bacillus thuringiensis serovar silo]OTW73726.1 hypothetical protein BK700_02135 [Bacillus thuringiensis serovar toguchini]
MIQGYYNLAIDFDFTRTMTSPILTTNPFMLTNKQPVNVVYYIFPDAYTPRYLGNSSEIQLSEWINGSTSLEIGSYEIATYPITNILDGQYKIRLLYATIWFHVKDLKGNNILNRNYIFLIQNEE